MRIYSLLILIPFNLLISFNAFGQEQSMPDWIIGVWHNPYESNMYNFEFWSFSDGNISLQKGIPNKNQEKENLKDKFPGYEIKEESNDSIYKIHFTKELENIIYEFKIHKTNFSEEPLMTISYIENGNIKREHLISTLSLFRKL